MKHLFAARFSKLLAGGILSGFFAGCSVLDPAEEIPSYLHIDAITLQAGGVQGSSRSSITEAWIFMDGKLLGGFELPCDVPILAEGTHSFRIRGGVKMNGLAATRAIYPSWKAWESSITLTRGQKVTVSPVMVYHTGTDFSSNTWMLDFDQQGTSLTPEPTSSAIIKIDSTYNLIEGKCGYVHLNNNDTTFFVGSSAVGYLMPATNDTWLEFDYRCDAPFTVGIVETVNTSHRIEWVAVLPNADWTKIYIRLTDPLAEALATGGNPSTVPYKIYFAMVNPPTQSESFLYIDNIKLLK